MKKIAAASLAALVAVTGSAIAADTVKTVPNTTATTPSTTSPSATMATDGQFYTETDATNLRAADIIGARIYSVKADVDPNTALPKAGADWDDLGEVNNILIGKDGSVKAVILGVGGFLGIGEKDVAVKMSELRFVKKQGDDADDYFIVVKSSKEALEKAPSFKVSMAD
jgi:hypothetical protein